MLAPGGRLGPYEILGPLGAGGMGVVVRARDPRLGRDVAIKALPDAFARDPDRVARFEREAKLLASLNHPNVAAILGLEEADGHRYLVLEYVEGPTLAERLASGPLPLEETLDVCRQIAAGVEAAHESGVVHRDLKPGNVKLTPAGQVKVLDFGLAKGGAATSASSDADLSASPTLTYAATGAGVILGTAAYMSPEQARGKAVDRRTDIWSFGCVLYECLAGRALFEGETVSDLIARILEREPDWSALPAATPPRVRELLKRCLRKDARERLRDIGDARLELSELLAGGLAATTAPAAAAPSRRMPAWPALALGLALAAAGAWLAFGRPARDPHLHVSVTHEAGGIIAPASATVALSPDGRRIAYAVIDSNAAELWVRDLDAEMPRRIAGVTRLQDVFWSPDGRWLGFATNGEGARLWKVPAEGGSPVSLCDVKWSRGATWGRHGDIVFAPAPDGPLYRVAASGGDPTPVTALDRSRHETGHRMPCFLPDGEHFLFAAVPRASRGWDIFAGALHSKSVKRVLNAGSGVTWAAPGYLLYVRDGRLVAQRFDLGRLEVRGDPLPIGDPPPQGDVDASWVATASDDGRLAMLHRRDPDTRVEWTSRTGEPAGALPLPPGRYTGLDVSPDGRSALAERTLSSVNVEIWHSDPARGMTTRVTPGESYAYGPVWLPDGASFVYSMSGPDGERLRLGRLGDAGPARAIATNASPFQHATGVSPDGRSVVFTSIDPTTRFDLWAAPLDGGAPARLVVRTAGQDDGGTLSPDGRWLAYVSDETGQPEIYLQPFPGPGPATRVSTDGGTYPYWRRDGTELFYERFEPGGGSVLAVSVDSRGALGVGAPHVLFHRAGLVTFAARDGERFLVSAESGTPPPATLTLMLDWRRHAGR